MRTKFTLLILSILLCLAGCSKSAAELSLGTYSGENLTVFQGGTLFAKPATASVTVAALDGSTITVRMDSLITGFPSVTVTCSAYKEGSGSGAKTYFSGEGKAGASEIIKIDGNTANGRMSLNFRDSVISDAVGRWMIGEYTYETALGNITVPSFSLDVFFDFSLISPEQVSALVTPLVTDFLRKNSPYFDNIEFSSGGKIGINYDEYHADAVIPRDSVDAVWGQSVAGLGTIGDLVSTGDKGLLHYYQDDILCGMTPPNTLISLANALLSIEKIPFQIPIPFVVPFYLKRNGETLNLVIDQTVLNPILAESRDTIKTLLANLSYNDLLQKIPAEYREWVKRELPEETFGDVKLYISLALDILLDQNTTYAITLSLIPYKKELRPWEH